MWMFPDFCATMLICFRSIYRPLKPGLSQQTIVVIATGTIDDTDPSIYLFMDKDTRYQTD